MTEAVRQILDIPASAAVVSDDNISLDRLMHLLQVSRLEALRKASADVLRDITAVQGQMKDLQTLKKEINQATDDRGEIDLTVNMDLATLLEKAKTEHGITFKEVKGKISADARSRLVENITLTLDSLNQQSNMLFQNMQKYINERMEVMNLIQQIIRPQHQDKMNKARKCAP